ncbi:MAG: hypothetical protein ABIH83_03380 [Candidatus Micrarchaeota archaeon]
MFFLFQLKRREIETEASQKLSKQEKIVLDESIIIYEQQSPKFAEMKRNEGQWKAMGNVMKDEKMSGDYYKVLEEVAKKYNVDVNILWNKLGVYIQAQIRISEFEITAKTDAGRQQKEYALGTLVPTRDQRLAADTKRRADEDFEKYKEGGNKVA